MATERSDGVVVVVDPGDSSAFPTEFGAGDEIPGEPIVVRTADEALAAVAERRVDCALTPQALPDGSGLALLDRIRDADPNCPVVLAPEDGDEALASAAIAAGVEEYVPRSGGEGGNRQALLAALERAIDTARERRRRTEDARGFRAVFDDPDTAAWLLEPDGRVRRANEAALASTESADGVCGRRFRDLERWQPVEDGSVAVENAVERAAAGEIVTRELTLEAADDGPQRLEITIRPVRDGSGVVTSLLARATDVTERARLEAELRESEELHRVTLNNMTDTVLITDDDGAFTYVCPNVNFIFGYTDEEIYEMGTIEELLGPDLFDREELVEEGVLTNLECTATDRAGREHTLLVNVREVSIQGGTTLYSCRDVTERKRREEALTALHRTARELLYAETEREIANVVVEDATDVLDCEATGAYLFDTDENRLQPVAGSPALESLHGPLPTRRATDDSVAGAVFLDGESRFYDDLHDAPELSDPTTGLRSAAFVPLGDHGLFLAGSSAVGAFDAVSRELTDLLAATAEAALDRVERERTLRERDRELKRRNRQLSRLNRINEIIREIDAALVEAETREEIERAVCERLTAADRFSFAWIAATDGDSLEARAHGGTDRGRDYLDSVSLSPSEGTTEPAVRTARTGEVTVVPNVADDLRDHPWRSEALTRDYQSAVGVPIAYDEFAYGVLTVYADRPDAFDDVTRTVLEELGETIASAIAAVERKRALLSNASTRLEFDVRDESFVLLRLARQADCTLSFDGGLRQRENGVAVFATVEDAAAEAVATVAADLVAVDRVQVIGDGADEAGDGGTVLLELSPPFLALQLADHGAVLRRVEATPDSAHVVVDVPDSVDAKGSADVVSSAFDDVELRSKRTVDRSTPRDLRSELLERLTDRQLEVVQLAYYGGYFESPRERSGEEIADALDISPAAFYRHNRTVQRKLFSMLFEELGVPATAQGVE
ncbi:bacterio-opsin activator [Halobiforma lacisalsi AJ5]|uniref:Bacterio-opsin activator n=1 Tax=Natronobacterium lacisalsi AJ5 TaxID=358396 RepID=M0LVA3_NATLA|nr:bacterio-opsin activator domain-containing protein [Halobiforma lacisalsi]APW97838.1 bacterio-opsin activator [Halobiforma lacisalsi AJ5]EMA37411.1 PAS/PAC sensor protein [Halobiforma lacisalsi AJ5]